MKRKKHKCKLLILSACLSVTALTGCASSSSQVSDSDLITTTAEPSSEYTTSLPETTISTEPETEAPTEESEGTTETEADIEETESGSESASEDTEKETSGTTDNDTTDTVKESSKETKPSKPAETKPAETKPSKPAETKPAETKPSKPAETKPAETKPSTPVAKSITASVNGTHYVGDTLGASDFTVTVKMSDGSTLTNPAGFSASPLTLSNETNSITVAYGNVSTSITVKASKKPQPAKAVSITATHNGKVYYKGDSIQRSDLTVKVTMSDGNVLVNPNYEVGGGDVLSSDNNTVTISYNGVSTSVNVKAKDRESSSADKTPVSMTATVKGGPYYHGDTITMDTVDVTVTLKDGTVLKNPEGVTFSDSCFKAPGGLFIAYYKDLSYCVITEIIYPCREYDFSRETALEAFKIQNEMRAEAGAYPLTWSEDLYEVAKKCAKACGDNGRIDHSLTKSFREYRYITSDGYEKIGINAENLTLAGAGYSPCYLAERCLNSIKNSSDHYETAIITTEKGYTEAAIAVYRVGDSMYVSYIFHYGGMSEVSVMK